MELNVEEAPNTTVVENIAAHEDQNTSEGGIIRNRLTNLEANVQKLTANEAEILKKQDQMTENDTKLFSKLSQLEEKLDDLTEAICRNNNRNKSRKNFILINKKAVRVSLNNDIAVQTNPEGDGQTGRKQVVRQEETPQ